MHCLLVAATPLEIAPFLEHLREGRVPGNRNLDIDVLISGIGLTAATYAIARQVHIRKPQLIIQAGVAGCFDKKIPLGSVVAISHETIADQSVVELKQLKTIFDLKLMPLNRFPFKNGWLANPHSLLFRKTGLRSVRGISVNEITTSPRKISFYREAFNPVAESMEGAALHYACLMENIPFLQLRSFSNYIGERNKSKWNMKEAIRQLNAELAGLLEKI